MTLVFPGSIKLAPQFVPRCVGQVQCEESQKLRDLSREGQESPLCPPKLTNRRLSGRPIPIPLPAHAPAPAPRAQEVQLKENNFDSQCLSSMFQLLTFHKNLHSLDIAYNPRMASCAVQRLYQLLCRNPSLDCVRFTTTVPNAYHEPLRAQAEMNHHATTLPRHEYKHLKDLFEEINSSKTGCLQPEELVDWCAASGIPLKRTSIFIVDKAANVHKCTVSPTVKRDTKRERKLIATLTHADRSVWDQGMSFPELLKEVYPQIGVNVIETFVEVCVCTQASEGSLPDLPLVRSSLCPQLQGWTSWTGLCGEAVPGVTGALVFLLYPQVRVKVKLEAAVLSPAGRGPLRVYLSLHLL